MVSKRDKKEVVMPLSPENKFLSCAESCSADGENSRDEFGDWRITQLLMFFGEQIEVF